MNGADQLRKKYLPNLTEYLACCTTIHQKIVRLLPPSYANGEKFSWKAGISSYLEISVQEQHKYTDVVFIKYRWAAGSKWLQDMEFQLNLCHDMNIAEVISFISNGHVHNLRNRCYTSPTISYLDEKKQIHQLLLEWLSLSLTC